MRLIPTSNADPVRLRSRVLGYFREHNDCHNPPGPGGGRFCSTGFAGDALGGSGSGLAGAEGGRGWTGTTAPAGAPRVPSPSGSSGPAGYVHKDSLSPVAKKAMQRTERALNQPKHHAPEAVAQTLKGLESKSLSDIAMIIDRDWRLQSNAMAAQGKRSGMGYLRTPARPYINAMGSLDKISDNYGADSGEEIVARFLSNATSYRGPIAKAVKAELKRRLGRR